MKIPSLRDQAATLMSIAALGLLMVSSAGAAGVPQTNQTLHNLQAAYNGETNAHSRYLAFAQKADAEGYVKAAALFRAAARAEEIHQTNHAAVIRIMGAVPTSITEFPQVKSTRENLVTATSGESYEQETMYPGFIEQAEAEHNQGAVWTFDMARKAEVQHFNLLTNALQAVANGWDISGNYYVCTVCGYTVDVPVTDRCISCTSPAEKYEQVS